MAARKILSGEITTAPKDTTGIVEAIRQHTVARRGAVKARAAAIITFGQLIVTAPAQLREHFAGTTAATRIRLAGRLRPDLTRLADPIQAAKLALA